MVYFQCKIESWIKMNRLKNNETTVAVSDLCSAACCGWTAARPGGSVEQRTPAWTSPGAECGRCALGWTPSSAARPASRSGWDAASCLTPPTRPCRDGPAGEGRRDPHEPPRRVWACRAGGAWAFASREGRGWGSLGTGGRLTGTVKQLFGLGKSPERNLY